MSVRNRVLAGVAGTVVAASLLAAAPAFAVDPSTFATTTTTLTVTPESPQQVADAGTTVTVTLKARVVADPPVYAVDPPKGTITFYDLSADDGEQQLGEPVVVPEDGTVTLEYPAGVGSYQFKAAYTPLRKVEVESPYKCSESAVVPYEVTLKPPAPPVPPAPPATPAPPGSPIVTGSPAFTG